RPGSSAVLAAGSQSRVRSNCARPARRAARRRRPEVPLTKRHLCFDEEINMRQVSRREDASVPDYRRLYSELRNYLAGQHLGSTRDEALLQEVVKVLLCKAYLDSAADQARSGALAASYRQAWTRVRSRLLRLLADWAPPAFD